MQIKIGSLVQTIFGTRVCCVTAIDTVEVVDSPIARHTEPQYHLEYGKYDFVNGFTALRGSEHGTIKAIASEITRVL